MGFFFVRFFVVVVVVSLHYIQEHGIRSQTVSKATRTVPISFRPVTITTRVVQDLLPRSASWTMSVRMSVCSYLVLLFTLV